MPYFMKDELAVPNIVDRGEFEAELNALRVREKAHTREGDAIAAARRRQSRSHLHPLMTVPQQSSQVPLFRRRHPNLWKPILHHQQLQQQACIPPIMFLFPVSAARILAG